MKMTNMAKPRQALDIYATTYPLCKLMNVALLESLRYADTYKVSYPSAKIRVRRTRPNRPVRGVSSRTGAQTVRFGPFF